MIARRFVINVTKFRTQRRGANPHAFSCDLARTRLTAHREEGIGRALGKERSMKNALAAVVIAAALSAGLAGCESDTTTPVDESFYRDSETCHGE